MDFARRRLLAQLVCHGSAGMVMTGCGNGIDVAEWTEEVKLHDGQLVVVSRKARARSSGFPNASRGGDIDFELKYAPMNVHWKHTWQRNPFSFEIFDGVPHLALYIRDRESCKVKPATDFSAQFLRWIHGQWVDVPQADYPTDTALMNLSYDYWGHSTADDFKGLIRWDDKRLPGRRTDTIKAYFERGKRDCRLLQST